MQAKDEQHQDQINPAANSLKAMEGCSESPTILEQVTIEELAVDGICGIY